ncbi:MAG: hypothetical protein GF421_07930 [Candidatus Aminicenantes bacterium]|nr:hypothetical protein [Candidatus Aminicenantes bacterium]
MRNRKAQILLASVFFLVILSADPMASQVPENKTHKKQEHSLVRLDLLKKKTNEIQVPLRNIFTGQKLRETQDQKQKTNQRARNLVEDVDVPVKAHSAQAEQGLEKSSLYLNLKYLGYIASIGKKVALVFYDREFLAVEKGTVLPDGIEVVDISESQIEVMISGSDKLVIKLEGEDQ